MNEIIRSAGKRSAERPAEVWGNDPHLASAAHWVKVYRCRLRMDAASARHHQLVSWKALYLVLHG